MFPKLILLLALIAALVQASIAQATEYCLLISADHDDSQELNPVYGGEQMRELARVLRDAGYLTPLAGCRSSFRPHGAGVNRDFTNGLRVALVRVAAD
ncbi:MAG: hypothetical protein U1A77_00840 [Pirellulales bacterium]